MGVVDIAQEEVLLLFLAVHSDGLVGVRGEEVIDPTDGGVESRGDGLLLD